MPPPPAEALASRIFLGPALRTQPDRRLVKLVREGYEAAFEEIVRRYRRPLDRFAAAIVGNRSEDVTQDAFSKALLTLRGSDKEIELRPWLYRIVRNTALNDLRDSPVTEELGEAIAGGASAAVEAERREEITELMERLRALPEPQRAAIVMRELEGLSHEEIAAALGVSGGAARQAIYRARLTLRDGLGLLLPLPLLRMLFDHGAEAAAGAAGGAAAASAASVAGAGGGASLGGLGTAGALKVGMATALLAGSVGAGVAIQHERGQDGGPGPAAAAAAPLAGGGGEDGGSPSPEGPGASGQTPSSGPGEDRSGPGGRGSGGDDRGEDDRRGDDRGHGGEVTGDEVDDSPQGGRGHGRERFPDGGHGRGQHSGAEEVGEDRSGKGTSGGSHSGHGGPGSGDGGGEGESEGGSGSGRSGSSGSGSGGSGSGGGSTPTVVPPPPVESPPDDGGSDSSDPGGGSSGPGGGPGSGGDDGP